MQHLTAQLARWHGRETRHRFAWGFARWAAIVAGVLAVCCFTDWYVDRRMDTPFWLRVLMTAGQVTLAAILIWKLLFRLNVPPIDMLAGRAEEAIPEFDHRLVTALQLNRPGARTAGMSPQLIAAVTAEAESLSKKHDLAALADSSRIEKAAMLFLPVVIFAAAFALLRPTLTTALLKRQCLMDVDIPRSVSLAAATPGLLPAGDPVRLRVHVRGNYSESAIGQVVVKPDELPVEKYDLKFDSKIDADTALYVADLPAASTPFEYTARLHDGRTRTPAKVTFAARPVVTEVIASLVLPQYVDPANMRRFEKFQPQGDVTTLPDSGLHVTAIFSKPVANAELILFHRPDDKPEAELRREPMTVRADRLAAEIMLPALPNNVVAYRVTGTDDHGFAVANPPRRRVGSANYTAPTVKLLPEIIREPGETGPLEDYSFDGMPLALGWQVQIGYHARSPLGIKRVFIWYRVNPQERENVPWTPLPMTPTPANPKLGRFLPDLGVFEKSGLFGQVEFWSVPANDEDEPDGLEAGGRFNFKTAALTKTLPDGKLAKLEVGDQVEFVVAAFDRRPDPNAPPGESASRIKAVVTLEQLREWQGQQLQSRSRLEELFAKQRRVFQAEKDKAAPPPK